MCYFKREEGNVLVLILIFAPIFLFLWKKKMLLVRYGVANWMFFSTHGEGKENK